MSIERQPFIGVQRLCAEVGNTSPPPLYIGVQRLKVLLAGEVIVLEPFSFLTG